MRLWPTIADMLGFHVDFVAGDPPAHARVCSDPTYASPCVFIRFEPLEMGVSPNHRLALASRWSWVSMIFISAYKGRGVEIVQEPEDRPWGLRQFRYQGLQWLPD